MSIDAIPTTAAKRSTMVVPASGKTIYTCPMHPEVQQENTGNCLKCGMTLEPKSVPAGRDDDENTGSRQRSTLLRIGR